MCFEAPDAGAMRGAAVRSLAFQGSSDRGGDALRVRGRLCVAGRCRCTTGRRRASASLPSCERYML
eukprot:4463424-Alexandrium_andersonii.AAC.1